MKLTFSLIITIIFCSGCLKRKGPHPDYFYGKVWGSKPVYSNDPALKAPSTDTPHAVKNAGKIYAYKNYLLQCEVGQGFHVIDHSDPSKARRIKFLKLLGVNEISIKNNYLYTNSYNDLVVINIADIDSPYIVKRVENAFVTNTRWDNLPEPEEQGYYECVDVRKGVVTGWVKDSIYYGCYKN